MQTLSRTAVVIILGAAAVGYTCAPSRTLPTEPTLTVFCHQGNLMRADLATPGPSHGDLTTWWANMYADLPASGDPADSPQIGIASGFNVTTSPDHELGDNKQHEFRVSNFNLRWSDSEDQLVWSGLHDYANEGGELINTCQRPIIGGTGRFLGRPGVAVVIPEGNDWFRIDLFLLD